jgi:MFS family permease
MFTIGIVFYTKDRFGWGLTENFRLAAAQGVVYVVGALLAHGLTGRLSHRAATVILHVIMTACCIAGVIAGRETSVSGVVAVLFVYTFFCAMAWPILESLVATGTDGPRLARRLGIYNIVWPAVSVAVLAVSGTVIENIPTGVFFVPAIAHAACIGLALLAKPRDVGIGADAVDARGLRRFSDQGIERTSEHTSAHEEKSGAGAPRTREPRTPAVDQTTQIVALWVSRLGLPATYAVIYGLMPLLPSLPAMERLDTANQTVLSSAWLAARWIAFVLLAMTAWWHTRPRVMVAAAVAMGVAFLGCALPPSQWFAGTPVAADVAALLFWQVVLGASLGVIYSGSLYFGMVLSEGSTEHSGYHEALIGLGWVLGPGAAVLVQWIDPDSRSLAVAAVGTVIGLSVLAVLIASAVAGRKSRRRSPDKTLAKPAQP